MANESQLHNFLAKIMANESSGGDNTNHPVIKYGVNKGTRAMGAWGLTHGTVQDILTQKRNREGQLSPELEDLRTQDYPTMHTTLEQNPDLQVQVAKELGNKVLDRCGGDEDCGAWMWINGHNTDPNKVTDDKLNNSEYVQRFRKLRDVVPMDKADTEPASWVPSTVPLTPSGEGT